MREKNGGGLCVTAGPGEDGMTARGALKRSKGVSQRLVRTIVHGEGEGAGALFINGREAKFNDRVQAGDEIRLVFPEDESRISLGRLVASRAGIGRDFIGRAGGAFILRLCFRAARGSFQVDPFIVPVPAAASGKQRHTENEHKQQCNYFFHYGLPPVPNACFTTLLACFKAVLSIL